MILNIHGMSNTMDSVDRLQQLQNFQQHMIPGKHKNAAHTILGVCRHIRSFLKRGKKKKNPST